MSTNHNTSRQRQARQLAASEGIKYTEALRRVSAPSTGAKNSRARCTLRVPNFETLVTAAGCGCATEAEHLTHTMETAARRLYGTPLPNSVSCRLRAELDAIESRGAEGYILSVAVLVAEARSRGIEIGAHRGFSPGSLVCYCLGITGVDPIAHGLRFERFLDPATTFMPNVLLEVEYGRRDEVFELVRHAWGTRVARLGAVGHLKNGGEFKSVHACGLVLSAGPVDDTIPLRDQRAHGWPVTDVQREDLELDGGALACLDVFGLRSLSLLADVKRRVGPGVFSDPEGLGGNGVCRTWELFAKGDIGGVYLFESDGMRDLVRQTQPTRVVQLASLLTLYRPGPMSLGTLESYARRASGAEPVTYEHLTTDPSEAAVIGQVFDETFGIPVFQEQLFALVEQIAGFSVHQTVALRKALSKKNWAQMRILREQFVDGGRGSGGSMSFSDSTLHAVWEWAIEMYANSLYAKSHAMGLATLAYRLAAAKGNWPDEFEAARSAAGA